MSAGQEQAVGQREFEDFFAGAYGRVLAQVIMLCGSREDAEDVTQEAFLEAYRAWDRIAGYELPEAWAYRVAVQRLWKTHRRRRTGQDRVPDVPVPVRASPEQSAEAREVLRLLAALPPRQRVTMVLFCLHGWSQIEIAKTLRMTRGGVAANVSKARRTLTEALDMAADDTSRHDPFTNSPQTARPSWIRLGRDPVVIALRDTQAWLRAAVEEDPERLARARAALARRQGESR
ncbi:sigma-70 family RNA polymerase sigma factor [Streptomyces sp. MBT65]|uniref:RNA polymerase sigma factor n=1 Tax=Streptomyces sp. MBT65 TaxID=1488395 RepID=UPI00190A3E38|nr:sigma-70 family RNA polymerase sigma factor [Streptomyces sp. MBT65]MBK3573232.1 sigma-70 family RNA polymerase sigma factor [Streptomyces sp. MBT65]